MAALVALISLIHFTRHYQQMTFLKNGEGGGIDERKHFDLLADAAAKNGCKIEKPKCGLSNVKSDTV